MKSVQRHIFLFVILAITVNLGLSASAAGYKYNMSYLSGGGTGYYTEIVNDAQNSLNEVSPDYFSLDSGGNLVVSPDAGGSLVEEMHKKGILVTPCLANGWDQAKGVAALNNADKLSSDLAAAVSAYNLDGVNIDIENVTPAERGKYVEFVRLLRSKLGSGKTVGVAVAANPYGSATGWAGSYDYAGLAKYCDYLMIMTYDESYYGGTPGPVASIGFIEKSLKYALSVVSKDKIVLGIPFYGRIWSAAGGAPSGYGISTVKVEVLIRDYSGTVAFDNTSKAACATISVKAGDVKPIVAGKELAAGTYKIWYSNEQSIKAALALVTKYDIKGTGSWSLGQESSQTWDYYRLWLNGCTFSDIQTSWARDSILISYMNQWMNGMSADIFAPDAPMTRAQAAAILVRMLGLAPEVNSAYGFDDCKGSWAEKYIDTARKYGVVSGIGGNLFAPEKAVTREEVTVMLNNILKYADGDAAPVFSDVSLEKNSWSYTSISALSEKGIITGYPDGSFKPGNSITRGEAAAIFSRLDVSLLRNMLA
ncbi:MAG: S-layer homology domain-containing protein [Oscillospiraceae bacterium]|nr:S-layer homology domain-containing protein [Oscillospiraceae bacterium]